MRILNLYAGIGGNRHLWGDNHSITAVEIDPKIAKIYKEKYPDDNVIVADAHKYLLEHYKEFEFIWSSPPCQSHTVCNYFLNSQGVERYPDMKLYEEIIFLKYFAKCKWAIENVKSYYEPLIKPQIVGRHYVWSNFLIPNIKINGYDIGTFNRYASKIKQKQVKKNQLERNCVNSKVGLHILNCAIKLKQFKICEF